MKISLEETLRRHKELWDKVGELLEEDYGEDYDGEDLKFEALRQLGYTEPINFGCWCCEFTGYSKDDVDRRNFSKCKFCPVNWNVDFFPNVEEPLCCMSYFSDYIDYVNDGDYGEATNVAYQIANLDKNPIYEEEE